MFKAIAKTVAVQGFQMATGLLLLVITSYLLGPEGRGVYGTVLAWSGLLAACGSFSLDSVLTQRASSGDEAWYAKTFPAFVKLGAMLVALTLLVAVSLYLVAPESFGALPIAALALGLALIPLLIWGRYQAGLLLSLGRLELRNRLAVVSSCLNLLFVALFVWLADGGVMGSLLAFFSAALVSGLVGISALWPKKGYVQKAEGFGRLLADGAKVHLSTVGHFAYGSIDVITLNAVAGPAAVGWYQMALRLIDVMLALPNAVATVCRSRMAGKRPAVAWLEQRRLILMLLVVLAGLMIPAYFIAPFAIPFVVGSAFEPSVAVFQLFLPILLGRGAEILLVPQIFARGYFLAGSVIALSIAGINATLVLWLVPQGGLEGAVTAALISFAALPGLIYTGWFFWFERDRRRAACP